MYQSKVGDQTLSLCIDCQLKMQQIHSRQNAENERMINFFADHIDAISGLPRTGARFPERQIVDSPEFVMNKINITDSNVGVVNTGTVHSIEAAVNVIAEGGNAELSEALAELTQGILDDENLGDEERKGALDLVNTVSAEASLAPEKQRKVIIKPLVGELAQLLQGSAAAMTIYEKVLPVLQALF